MEQAPIVIGQAAQLQIPLIGIVPVEADRDIRFGGFERIGVLVSITEAKGAVVVEIIAQEHVCRRSFFASGPERRMRVENAHNSRPAEVGSAVNADAAIVIRQVFHQPIDRVVSVGGFIDHFLAWQARGPHHHELSFRPEFAADVLTGEDITIGGQFLELIRQLPGKIGGDHPDTIRSAR